jgi:putative salt-induced outer membrane protein YdiY
MSEGQTRVGRRLISLTVVFWASLSPLAWAQQPAAPPAEPPPTWTGNVGAGLSLTSGNTDTLTYNVAFEVTRDPKTRHVMKWTGLYLRSEQNDVLNADRASLAFRDQYALNSRAFVYGQIDYLRDSFKLIDYLIAPTAGIGYKVIDTATTTFAVDAGAGVVWEKNDDFEVKTSGAVTAGERFTRVLTATTSFKHAATALWKANDFGDGLYTVGAGIAVKINERMALTVDLVDTFKSEPPAPGIGKNDVALVLALTVKY